MAELSTARPEDDGDSDSDEPREKRVRFPKGRKVKPGKVKPGEEKIDAWKISDEVHKARIAAKERALRRFTDKLAHDLSAAEVQYEEHELYGLYEYHGWPIDLFNLENEREEGYFDENGYYIEYVNKETEYAWLDSADSVKVDRMQDLTTKDLGQIKRQMADVLEPGETVLQALRRLKGTSNNRQEKMSPEKKNIFDQLTEDATRLLEDDVYHEKQKVIELEAGGYERLAKREQQPLDVFAEDDRSSIDMFAEDDGKAAENPTLLR